MTNRSKFDYAPNSAYVTIKIYIVCLSSKALKIAPMYVQMLKHVLVLQKLSLLIWF